MAVTGLDNIIEQIIKEAEKEAETIIKKAEKEAEKITFNTQKEISKQQTNIIRTAEKEAINIIERANSTADLNSKKELLAVKQSLIDEILSKSLDEIKNLDNENFVQLIFKMIKKYAEKDNLIKGELLFSTGEIKRFDDKSREKLDLILKENNLTLSNNEKNLDGGFILIYGDIEENCSFKAIFEVQKDILQDKASNLLFKN